MCDSRLHPEPRVMKPRLAPAQAIRPHPIYPVLYTEARLWARSGPHGRRAFDLQESRWLLGE